MNKATKLLELATLEFGTLTPPEERLFRVTASGQVADYTSKAEEDNDPAQSESWGADRVLSADRLAWLCTNSQASKLVGHRGVRLKGVRIEGRLDLEDARISFPLTFEKGSLPQGIILRDGEIRKLDLRGTHSGPIKADNLKVGGDVFLHDGFRAEGEVSLLGVTIDRNIECDGGWFINADGCALCGDGLHVGGDVYLSNGFRAEGEVRLVGVTISGDLNCIRGTFINTNGYALNAEGLRVGGGVFLRDGFKAEGEVNLLGATMDSYFIWTDVDSPEKVTLDLRSAKIGTLWDKKDSWPDEGKLFLHSLVYDEIYDEAPKDAETRINWLRRQYDKEAEKDKKQFRPQPYEQLAGVLRRSGRDVDAKKILIAKNKDKARLTELLWSEWLWYRAFGLLIGYGYQPWRAAWFGLVIVLLGWLFFWAGFHVEVMTPTKEAVVASGGFCALVYSLDVFVPLVDLRQANNWLPNANQEGKLRISEKLSLPVSGEVLRYFFWFEIIAGWALTTLLVVGVTGLVRT